MELLRTLFGLTPPVSRRFYATVGLSLAAFKYAVDATLAWIVTGQFWNPLVYVLPLVSLQGPITAAPTGLVIFLELWTLPFLWIGLVLTLRRLVDAGMSRWVCLLYFVPGINYLLMLGLCALPSRPRAATTPARELRSEGALLDAVLGIVSAAAIALAMIATSVYLLKGYGGSLFLGTPVVIGAVNGYLINRRARRSWAWTLAVVSLSIFLTGAAILLFALEGLVCLLMAAPIALTGGILGATLGWAIATSGRTPPHQIAVVLLALPLLAGFESRIAHRPRRQVTSSIEIDVPPERVWPSVIGFSELPAPAEIVFRTGIAFPKRAHIEGDGVDAIRYCEFSTGPFVEPITAYEPPTRLSFDVVAQPDPMREWSPYRDIHPPHLDGYFRSVAGEFRLIPLPNNRTRLEGSTWYELDLSPQGYWEIWADELVHAIHMRVLSHVKRLAETGPREETASFDGSKVPNAWAEPSCNRTATSYRPSAGRPQAITLESVSTVLIVDDNDDVREGARRLLEREGYTTLGAGNGAEALHVLEDANVKPCMIVVDLMMPVMNGWQLLAALMDDRRWSKIPRLVMTAYGGNIHFDETPVLQKPFDCDLLIGAVRDACGST